MKKVILIVLMMSIVASMIAGCSNRQSSSSFGREAHEDFLRQSKANSSGFVGKWQTSDGGRMLIIFDDGTAMTPGNGNWNEEKFKWHTEDNRLVFDGWVVNKGYGFGYGYATIDREGMISLHDQAGTPGGDETWLKVKE